MSLHLIIKEKHIIFYYTLTWTQCVSIHCQNLYLSQDEMLCAYFTTEDLHLTVASLGFYDLNIFALFITLLGTTYRNFVDYILSHTRRNLDHIPCATSNK